MKPKCIPDLYFVGNICFPPSLSNLKLPFISGTLYMACHTSGTLYMACHTSREKVLLIKTGLFQTGSVFISFNTCAEVKCLNKAIPIPVVARTKCVGLWPLACWDWGFESRREHGCLSVVECCALAGCCLCDGSITRPENSYRVRCV